MSLSNKKIKKYFKKGCVMSCNEMHIQATIHKSEKAFFESEKAETLDKISFLYQQSKYIKKRWWIGQGILLLILCFLLQFVDSSFYIHKSIGITAPLFVVLIIPEIWKNKTTNSTEIECAAYYSLRQIYAARLLLFALVDLALLSVFFWIVLFSTKLTISELMIQFFIPFNVTCCICFRTLYGSRNFSEGFSLLLCFIWSAIWSQIVITKAVYNVIVIPIWWVLLVISFLYLGHCIMEGQKRYLVIWEGKSL